MIILNEVTICEAGTLVENVVVRLRIESVVLNHWILHLDFMFYHKGDIAER